MLCQCTATQAEYCSPATVPVAVKVLTTLSRGLDALPVHSYTEYCSPATVPVAVKVLTRLSRGLDALPVHSYTEYCSPATVPVAVKVLTRLSRGLMLCQCTATQAVPAAHSLKWCSHLKAHFLDAFHG